MQERWVWLRRSLWQPPRPHGEQPRERVVGPLELFYDLAVVVLVAQVAHRLAGHLSWAGLGQFAVVFTLVWIAWANGSLHHELHGHDDARARSTFLLQILVLAAMGAAMVSLVDHAQDGRTPAATAWVLGAGAAVVLGATMLVAATLPARDRDRGLYRPLARTCTASAPACLCLAAARPAPLLLALGLVLLLSIPWVYAVARRLAGAAGGSDRGSGPSGVKVSDAAPSLRRSATAGRPADLRG